MDANFKIWRTSRENFLKYLQYYSLDQLNKIPEGMRNNLIWNVGHIIVTQQGLVYSSSGVQSLVTDEMMDTYKEGTVPTRNISLEEINQIKSVLISTLNQTILDYENAVFKEYTPFVTKTGRFSIQNLNDAIAFNNYHEGIHLGFMMKIKRYI